MHCRWRAARFTGVNVLWPYAAVNEGSQTGFPADNESKQLSSSDGASNTQHGAQTAKSSPPDSVEEHSNNSGYYPASSLTVSHASFSEAAISLPGRQDTHGTERRPSVSEHEVQHTGPSEEHSGQQHQQQQQQQRQRSPSADSPSTTVQNGNTCVPPEAIFGCHGPRIWPIVTGGSAWCKSHEARTIPLAPLQRQMREPSTVSTATVDASQGNAMTGTGKRWHAHLDHTCTHKHRTYT